MTKQLRSAASSIAMLLAIAAQVHVVRAADTSVVRIALKPVVNVADGIVEVGDIATLSGGTPATRRVIAQQDLAKITDVSKNSQISSTHVHVRLQLAAIDGDSYQVEGARVVKLIRNSSHVAPAEIVHVLRKSLAEQYQVAPGDLDVRLTSKLESIAIAHGPESEVRVDVFLPERLTLGTVRATAAILVDGELRQDMNITAKVGIFQSVARASKGIERGREITSADITRERRLVTTGTGAEYATDVIGQVTKRALAARTIIRQSDLATTPEEGPIVMRSRSTIRLTAKIGGVNVSMRNAIALQPGRVGDTIRVQNMASKTVLVGRVVSASEVEVVSR